jgi:hypothetical protein
MIIQQCNRCKKKDTYSTGGKPTLFATERDPFCISCNTGWDIIQQTMKENFSEALNTRRDTYFHLGETP